MTAVQTDPPLETTARVPGSDRSTASNADSHVRHQRFLRPPRILFDVTHPAHVHLFRHAIEALSAGGFEVAVTSRQKDLTTDLLDAYGIEHTILSARSSMPFGLAAEWIRREIRTLRYARRFDPDVVVSRLNPPAAHAGKLTGATSIVFHDTTEENTLARTVYPFVDHFCTPKGFDVDFGDRQRRYDGFHELAYLHPNRFTPDLDRLTSHGVDPDEPYAVLRFVSMDAHHDVGKRGFSIERKRRLVEELSAYGSVYISTEGGPEPALSDYQLPVPPDAMHDLLSTASVLVTDSNTMAAESALLGTPVVRSNAVTGDEESNFAELGEHGLVISTADRDEAIDLAVELAADPTACDRWSNRRRQFLKDKVDVTEFILELITDAATLHVDTRRGTTRKRNSHAEVSGALKND
ncbi:MAG: DUF354 domain-containing protein [Halobacteriota archaeon]